MINKDPLQLIEDRWPKDHKEALGYLDGMDIRSQAYEDIQKLLALVKAQREVLLNSEIDHLSKMALIFKFNVAEKEIFSPKEEGKE